MQSLVWVVLWGMVLTQNIYQQYCLNEQCSGDVTDYGDDFIHGRNQAYLISIFSLRKKFVETNFKINQAINLFSINYLSHRNTTDPTFYFQAWVHCLDANSKRKMWNMAWRSREKFNIEVHTQNTFLLRLSETKVEVLYDSKGLYGSLVDYHVCEVNKLISHYHQNQIIRDLHPERCVTMFNRFQDQRRYMIICLPSPSLKDKFLALFRTYKSRCYPNIKVVPQDSYRLQTQFSLNQPLYQFSLWMTPFLDQLAKVGDYPLTFYLSSSKIYYQTYQYLFLYDSEPIELLYLHLISPDDSHVHCCHNVVMLPDQPDQFCIRLSKQDSSMYWTLCSYMKSHINHLHDTLVSLMKHLLLNHIEYPIIFSEEQQQFSMNTAYDYLKGLTPDLDYNTCQPDSDDPKWDDYQDKDEEGEEEEQPDGDTLSLKNSPEFKDDSTKGDMTDKQKVLEELLELEDFSEKVLAGRHLKGNVFIYVRDQLRRVCQERRLKK